MKKAAIFTPLAALLAEQCLNDTARGEVLPKGVPEIPADLVYDKENHKFKLLPSPEEMADRLTDGSQHQKDIFFQIYNSALKEFDVNGYNWLMNTGQKLSVQNTRTENQPLEYCFCFCPVMDQKTSYRFLQTLAKVDNENPHVRMHVSRHTS